MLPKGGEDQTRACKKKRRGSRDVGQMVFGMDRSKDTAVRSLFHERRVGGLQSQSIVDEGLRKGPRAVRTPVHR